MLSALASTIHIYGLALLVASFFMRTYHLSKDNPDLARLKRVFFWDNLSLFIVLTVMGVGVWRMWLEKGFDYYIHNQFFWFKMGILTLAWCIETPIMIKLIQWRMQIAKGHTPNTSFLPVLRKLEILEGSLMIAIVFCAAMMSRGFGQAAIMQVKERQPVLIEQQLTNLKQGAVIYRERCQSCHQMDGRGNQGIMAVDFTATPSRLYKSDAALLMSIAEGIAGTGMPPWKSILTEEDMRNVLGWIRSQYGHQMIQK